MKTKLEHPDALLHMFGQKLGTTDWREITQEQVDLFADATGDHQWIHTDPGRAAAGPFGSAIAHGYLTLSLVPVLLDEVLEIENLTAALNYGVNKVRFPAPLLVGSKLRATVTVAGAQRTRAGIEAELTVMFEVLGGGRPVCIADVVLLYR